MIIFEGKGGLVAYFRGAEILDGAGIYIAVVDCPVIALGGEFLECVAVKLNKGFLYNGFHFAVTALHVHHHCDGYAAGVPLY